MLKNIIYKIKQRFTKQIDEGKISLRVAGISYSQIQNIYILILEEEVPNWNDPNNPPVGARRVPIVINFFEAQSIVIEIQKIEPTIPLIYDFIKNLSLSYDFKFKEVDITELTNGELYTKIICDNKNKTKLDIKPAEAVALSLRLKTPIYISEELLNRITETLQDKYDIKRVSEIMKDDKLENINVEDLKVMLQESIDREDYEKASLIRDEINKKNKVEQESKTVD